MHLEPKEFTLIPTGSYPAQIIGIDEAEGTFGPQIKWTFDLGEVEDVDGNTDVRTLTGYTSQTLSTKSKLWQWVQAAGLDPAEGLDTDDLMRRRVVLEVAIQPRKNGDGEFCAIINVRRAKPKPARATAAKPAPAPEPEPEDDPDDGQPF